MKKHLLLTMSACFVMALAGNAFADDITITGNLNYQYRDDYKFNYINHAPDMSYNGYKTTLTLNLDAPISKDVDFYATFNWQGLNGNLQKDGSAYDFLSFDPNATNNGGFDSFGVKYKHAGWTYNVGQQGFTIGSIGIVYDNGYLGNYSLPYAAIASGKIGATDMIFIAARTHYQDGISQDSIYAAQGSYTLNAITTVGGFLASDQYGTDNPYRSAFGSSAQNFIGIDSSFKLTNRLGLDGEYVKSNGNNYNSGYMGLFTYKLNPKNKFTAGYYHVGALADMTDYNWDDMTTAPNSNTKGWSAGWKYTFDKNHSFNVAYKAYKLIDKNSDAYSGVSTSADRNSFRAGMTINF